MLQQEGVAADAHDAGPAWVLQQKGLAADAHDAGAAGCYNEMVWQLMLMMLAPLGATTKGFGS